MIVVFHSFTEKSSLLGRRPYGFVSNQAFLPSPSSFGRISSVGSALDFRAGSRGFDSRDRTKTQIKITEK